MATELPYTVLLPQILRPLAGPWRIGAISGCGWVKLMHMFRPLADSGALVDDILLQAELGDRSCGHAVVGFRHAPSRAGETGFALGTYSLLRYSALVS